MLLLEGCADRPEGSCSCLLPTSPALGRRGRDLPEICLLLWGWAGEAGLAAWDLPALMRMASPAHYSNGDTTLLTVTHTTWPCSEQAGPSPSHRAKHSRQASRFLPCFSSQLKKLTLLSSVLTFAGCPVGHYSFIHNTQAPCE